MVAPQAYHSGHAAPAPYAAARAVAPAQPAVPDVADEDSLSDRVEQAVKSRTGGRVRGLRVEVCRDEVLLSGECPSFHCKQLAQHAARTVVGKLRLTNRIEVR
ncbi:MAG: BON domain-containing protein [Pirellulales bacterium]|nr:BON domain-containing protein [Pirellulales bacterium]